MTIDPELTSKLSAILLSVALAAGTWLYDKVRGRKHQSVTELLDGIVRNALHDVAVTAESRAADLTGLLEAKAWRGLALAGIPRSDTTVLLVHAAVQTLVADAIEAAKSRARNVDDGIAANVASIKAELAKPAPAPLDLPRILEGTDVTILPRDGTEVFKPVGGGKL